MTGNNLREIKSGETGKGLLIENDGYISLNDEMNKKLYESLNSSNDNMEIPNPFIVNAVFQKFGIENANGRIYPENILKREVEKYQIKIKERRGYGECYTPDTLILTKDGWKALYDVKEGDEILTLNTNTNEIEIQPISKKIEYDYDGDMIRISGRNINDLVTPDHGYPIYDRNSKFKGFYTANEIFNKLIPGQNHSFIPKKGEWVNKGDDFYEIGDKKIPMDKFMKFLGIYLAEGDYRKTNNAVQIYQKKESVCEAITELLDDMGYNYNITHRKDGYNVYIIRDKFLNEFVRTLGDCYTKHIPQYFKNQSKINLQYLYEWFVLGDGRIRGNKRRKNTNLNDDVFSTSKQLILDLNEIQLKIGYSGNFHIENRNYDGSLRLIKGENSHEMYFSLRSLTKGIYLDERIINVTKEYYKGQVMCVEVPNHTWYCMCNNKCHWTKNCNHPSDSVIDLGRIAMNIIELHWENSTLVGKIEIPLSPGFRKYGIISCLADMVGHWILSGLRVGVSSRGLGTVEQRYGKMIVGDDFELVCWDFVSEPSTPGAWVSLKSDDLSQFIESFSNKKPLINNSSKNLEQFNNWLNL